MNLLNTFNFEHMKIPTFRDDNGDPWFLAIEVCRALEIVNVSQACARLDEDEKMALEPAIYKTYSPSYTGFGPLIISEPGLYRLMGSSNSQQAKAFCRWINHEVLPSIRKTGQYVKPLTEREQTLALARQLLESEAQIQALTPMADFGKAITQTVNLHTINGVAKIIGGKCGQKKLFAFLRDHKVLFKRGKDNLPKQRYIDDGWFKMRVNNIPTNHGNEAKPQVMVTGVGLEKITSLWNNPPAPKK